MHGNSSTSTHKARMPRTCGAKILVAWQVDSKEIDSMSQQYLYGGSSWARTSFDTATAPRTNLAKEWDIPHYNLSKRAISVLESLKLVTDHPDKTLPIVFLYHDPIFDLEYITGMSYKEFVTCKDWKTIWNQCNQYCLDKIDSLDRPVLLIGASAGVVDHTYKNIIVGHHNWQLWLAEQAGMEVIDQTVHVTPADGINYCLSHFWSPLEIQKCLHENPSVVPDKTVVDAIWNVFSFWKELENAGLFFEVHPNYKSNKLFAEFLKPTVLKFLNEHK